VTKGTTPTSLGFHYTNEGIRFVKAESLRNRRIDHALCTAIDELADKALERSRLCENDVLITIAGTLGRVARVHAEDLPANTNQAVAIIRPNQAITSEFLCRFLQYAAANEIVSLGSRGTGLQNLNLAQISAASVPVPPLAEQIRIIAKIDAIAPRLSRAQAEFERVELLVNRLRETALERAFYGKLLNSGELKDSGLPNGWKTVRFDEAAEIASNLVHPDAIADLPHIAPNHIEPGKPKLLPYRTIREDGVISGKHHFFPGQLLYSKIRPYLRKVVHVDFEGGCSADMYPINSKCHPRYLMYWMLSPQFTWLTSQQEGRTVLPKINQAALNAIPTPLAPEELQVRIAAKLDSIFAYADRLKAETVRALALTNRLESSLLRKAFRGELVPQDPKDAPADIPGDRIRGKESSALKKKNEWRNAKA
jgi:type I restriction enzyme S subunit